LAELAVSSAGFRARLELVGQPVHIHWPDLGPKVMRCYRRILIDDSFGFFLGSGFKNNKRDIVPLIAIHPAGQ
jgi:hypothetical protein